MDPLDRLRLHFSEWFDLAPSNLRAFISSVHGACDADETFRDNQLSGIFIQIGKDDDFDHALQIFQCEIGHPVALLGQHGFDGRDDAADFHLTTVG